MIEDYRVIHVGIIDPSPTNPRKRFDEIKLAELAESIKTHGLIQPILVRPRQTERGDRYEVVAGERRYRATKLAECPTIRAVVRDLSDSAVLEIQLLENNQREDVHPMEESAAIRRILDAGAYGAGVAAVKKVAEVLGKSVRYVYDRLAFAKLTEEAQNEFLNGEITAGHAIELARLKPEDQSTALQEMLTGYDFESRGRKRCPCLKSVSRLQLWIEHNVTLHLEKAPWALTDAQLLPMAGACSACPKNSNHEREALGETPEKSPRCLDRACYRAKQSAVANRAAAEIIAQHPDALAISGAFNGEVKTALWGCDLTVVDENREGAVKGVVVEPGYFGSKNRLPGEVIYVIPPGDKEATKAAEAARIEKEKDNKAKAKAKAKIETAYRESLWDYVASGFPGLIDQQLGAALLGYFEKCVNAPRVLKALGIGKDIAAESLAALAGQAQTEALIRFATAHELEVQEWHCYRGRKLEPPKILECLAESMGLDLAHIRREAADKLEAKATKSAKTKQPKFGPGANPGAS